MRIIENEIFAQIILKLNTVLHVLFSLCILPDDRAVSYHPQIIIIVVVTFSVCSLPRDNPCLTYNTESDKSKEVNGLNELVIKGKRRE